MEALDNFVESNPHIVVSGMLDLNVENYFFSPISYDSCVLLHSGAI